MSADEGFVGNNLHYLHELDLGHSVDYKEKIGHFHYPSHKVTARVATSRKECGVGPLASGLLPPTFSRHILTPPRHICCSSGCH
jgi:hypothetical protein